jgi:hypothetical protein
MLTLISGGIALGAAMAGAKLEGGGASVGIAMGLVLGALSVVALRQAGALAFRKMVRHVGLLYFGAFAWMLVAAVLATEITRLMIRAFR